MAYLGQSNALYDPTRVTPTTVQTFNGDGITTQFNLQYSVLQSIDIEVLVENVFQQPDYAYTAIGNVVTFTSPPPVGTNNIYVRFGKVTGLTGTVPDGSVTSSKLANNIRLLATDMYTGTGSQTAFNLSDTPADANSLIVTVNGVGQAAPSNYTVSGSTITFTAAPSSGANVVIRNVGFRTTQTLFAFPSGTQMVQPVITGGSANNMTLTNATITGGSANGIMYVNSSNTVTSGSGLVFDGTNVGIGTSSPGSKLTVVGSVSGSSAANGYDAYTASRVSRSFCWGLDASGNYGIWDTTSGANNRLLIDSSGNLGLGVTPSAWIATTKAIQNVAGATYNSTSGATLGLVQNGYTDGTWKYVSNGYASRYYQNSSAHYWEIAPSGTAGNAISFTQAMTLTSAGALGIGTTSPSAIIHAVGSTPVIQAESNVASGSSIFQAKASDASVFAFRLNGPSAATNPSTGQIYTTTSMPIVFSTSSVERMRIDSSGNLLVGTTSQVSSGKLCVQTASDHQLVLDATNTSAGFSTLAFSSGGAAKTLLYWAASNLRFYVVNATAGVYLAVNGTSWTANSDERLKTDLKPILNAAQKVSTLRAVTGRFKTDEEGVSRSFLIAQDVQAVLPEAVDASDPDKLGVAYTDTIPLLVAAIKELSAKVDSLQSELTELKSTK